MVHLRPCRTLLYLRWFVPVLVGVALGGLRILAQLERVLHFQILSGDFFFKTASRTWKRFTASNSGGSHPISAPYQSSNDVPSAFAKGKNQMYIAICVLSSWYTFLRSSKNTQPWIHRRRRVNAQNIHTHAHIHTYLLTLPRSICQDDSWTLDAVEFARQNPSLG